MPNATSDLVPWAALTTLRRWCGLSMKALSTISGVSVGHISDLESGRRQASPDVCRRLADALKVPLIALDRPDEGSEVERCVIIVLERPAANRRRRTA